MSRLALAYLHANFVAQVLHPIMSLLNLMVRLLITQEVVYFKNDEENGVDM